MARLARFWKDYAALRSSVRHIGRSVQGRLHLRFGEAQRDGKVFISNDPGETVVLKHLLAIGK